MQRLWCCLSCGKVGAAPCAFVRISRSLSELNPSLSHATRRRYCTFLSLCRTSSGDGACSRCWPWLAASGTSGKRVSSRGSWSRPSWRRYVCLGAYEINRVACLFVTGRDDAPGVIRAFSFPLLVFLSPYSSVAADYGALETITPPAGLRCVRPCAGFPSSS